MRNDEDGPICKRRPLGTDPAVLAADHAEKMERKRRTRERGTFVHPRYDPSRNADASYRKSIWPDGKTATPARMGAL